MAKRMHLVAEARGDTKDREKVIKAWDSARSCIVQRYRSGSQPKSVGAVQVEPGDTLDSVLELAQGICDEDALEAGPGHYIAAFRAEDERALGSIALVGGSLPEEGTVESEQLRSMRAMSSANTALAKNMETLGATFAKTLTDVVAPMAALSAMNVQSMQASAAGVTATADATVRIATLQFMADETRHERADERAKNEADAKNMADALRVGQSIATPLVGIYAEHLKEELAEKREEKKREKAKKRVVEDRERAAEDRARAEAEAEAAPKRGKKKRGKKEAPKTRMRRPKAAAAATPPTPEPAPEEPKPEPKRRPSSGLVADVEAFLDTIDDDGTETGEWQRLHEIVGQDLWDCLIAAAKAPSDAAAVAIMAKAVDLVEGPLIPNGNGEREYARAMPKAARKKLEADLGTLLGIARGLQLKALLAKGGVRL